MQHGELVCYQLVHVLSTCIMGVYVALEKNVEFETSMLLIMLCYVMRVMRPNLFVTKYLCLWDLVAQKRH